MRKKFGFDFASDQAILTPEEVEHIETVVIETIHHKLIARDYFPIGARVDPGAKFYVYYTETDPSDAVWDMDGVAQADDSPLKEEHEVKLGVLYKTFHIPWRDIESSRRVGPSLIDDCVRTAAWEVADLEDRLFLSGECTTWLMGGIQGLATATGRGAAAASGNWPANAIADINTGRAWLQAQGFTEDDPVLIGPPAMIKCLDAQVANTGLTYRSFLTENDLISEARESANVYAADCGQDSVLLIVPGPQNFYMVEGLAPTTILWYDKMKSVYGTVREIVSPVVSRPQSIYEITDITCA